LAQAAQAAGRLLLAQLGERRALAVYLLAAVVAAVVLPRQPLEELARAVAAAQEVVARERLAQMVTFSVSAARQPMAVRA
jgi:ABC-type thiamin/hydroxymethylpyrimidine transport system permease subunit